MAVINLDLLASPITYINSSNAADGDVLNITAIGSSTLIVREVDVEIGSIAGVSALSEPKFMAGAGGSITLNHGLLNVSALTGMTFVIEDDGKIELDASALDLLSGVTNLLNTFTVNYIGAHMGSFTYDPPALSLLGAINFTVTDMQAGDEFIIANRTWSLDTTLLGGPESAYRNGMLYLQSGDGLLTQFVQVKIPITQAEAKMFFANQSTYLSGGVFTFPGDFKCYAEGTLILTEEGYRPVEELCPGDLIVSADGRLCKLLWVSSTALDARLLDLRPELRPIRIAANALGEGLPFADLVVSPQHRIWVNGSEIMDATDGQGGLIAAKHLMDLPGVALDPEGAAGVRYHHLLLEEHEVIIANGLLSESLLLGPWTMRNLDARERRALTRIVPDFERACREGGESRHVLLTGQVARKIVKKRGARVEYFVDPTGPRCTRLAMPILGGLLSGAPATMY